ncbi:MAG: FAD:protein FMN transferase [Deltaproteobacteria bacterium]|nr:FAD:protein FMN transferase [Deltaproteobacteria bacterium]
MSMLLAALMVAATVGLAPTTEAEMARAGQPVMGTILQVTVVASDSATARSLADAAVTEARRWDDVLTTWRAEGELARLNARAGLGAARISRELAAALRQMRQLSAATGGAFDPGVGPLVRVWRRPGPHATAPAGAGGSYIDDAALTLTGDEAALAAGAALDAGAIGKGIALDAIAARLRAGGAAAAFLDFGGSSQLAIGAPPEAPEGWPVLVAGVLPGSAHGVIALRDAAASTSQALGAGAEAGPIIDPRSGMPVRPPLLATVLAPDATTADAWSTALIVMGRAGLTQIDASGLAAFMEDANGSVTTRRFLLQTPRPATWASARAKP